MGERMNDGLNAVERLGAAAQNALEMALFGGLDTGEQASPYDVVAEEAVYRLRRYFPGHERPEGTAGPDRIEAGGGHPVLLVPPLMLACEVYDVSPASSAVATLADHGVDPWVVDFGAPEREAGGLRRTLADHVLAVSDAVERVQRHTGRPVHLCGYSQGGMFCYQAAAYRHSDGVASLITFGSPVDARTMIPLGVPEEWVLGWIDLVNQHLPQGLTIPGWVSRVGFRLLDPAKAFRARWDFARQLHDREALVARERQRRFIETEGWVSWPGPAMADLLRELVAQNRLLSGGFEIGGRLVTLADITSPVLCFVGTTDKIGTPQSVRAIRRAAPRAETFEVALRAGHFGLVVGNTATRDTWPVAADWVRWREGDGPQPEPVRPLEEVDEEPDLRTELLAQAAQVAQLSAEAGVSVGRAMLRAAGISGRAASGAARAAAEQLPRLYRLDTIGPDSRISLGLLLAEQARRHPDRTFFLYEGRGQTYRDASRRVDNIVAGLLSLGVRQGERVGVLMRTRPTLLALLAALSRLGATAVLLRPDGDLAREAALGEAAMVVADPPHAAQAHAATSLPVYALGGLGEPRPLPAGVIDMEAIDPEQVRRPAWYRPDPGCGRDLAFVLFTGEGSDVRANRITNRRWAVSAFGTASTAALSESDTVYSLTPLHHPSGLLTSAGGAITAGCRLALAVPELWRDPPSGGGEPPGVDPAVFWAEVRRYGATAVSYTWALLGPVLAAPPDPVERAHPIRLFLGSGLPPSYWRDILRRFAPARVLEFYASTEGEAVLANVAGKKVGSKGRPLPGSAPVRLARFDTAAGRIVEGPDGLAERCPTGDVGLLLSAPRDPAARAGGTGPVLRGVFRAGDTWVATGDLFRRDADGDYWLVDRAAAVVHTPDGPAYAGPVEDALGGIAGVDLAVAYGVEGTLAAAVTLRPGTTVSPNALDAAFADLPPSGRPAAVAVVDHIPLTTWFRPRKAALACRGLPRPGTPGTEAVWTPDPVSGRYQQAAP